jgi:hypothetical protein
MKLELVQLNDNSDEDTIVDEEEEKSLAELWVLAEGLLLPELQNTVIDAMNEIRSTNKFIHTVYLAFVYSHTEAGSPLRRYYVDACKTMHTDSYKSDHDHFPHEMLLELVPSLTEDLDDVKEPVATDYHVSLFED